MKKKLLIIVFVLFITILPVVSIFNNKDISFSERRYLAKFPTKLNNDFFDNLDKYFTDHFIFRDQFRSIKAFFNNDLLMMKDNNGIYIDGDYIYEIDKVIDDKSLTNLANIINKINDTYFKDNDSLFVAIPSKNHYTTSYHLEYNYNDLYNSMSNKLNMNTFDLSPYLSLEDYYYTDIHWRQENLFKIAEKIVSELGVEYVPLTDYEIKEFDPFYGALYAKAASFIKPDTIKYLDSSYFKDVKVFDLEKNKEVYVYDTEALESVDAYSVYLDGPSSFIKIENPNAKNDESLVVFRDSFSSSLIPLLIPSFKEIEIVDIRYYNHKLLENLELNLDSKVLYIYGSEVMNNSYSIR